MAPIYLLCNFFSGHWNPNLTLSFPKNVLLKFIDDHLLQVNVFLGFFLVLMRVRGRKRGEQGCPGQWFMLVPDFLGALAWGLSI